MDGLQTDGWMDGWVDGWVDYEQKDGRWTDRQILKINTYNMNLKFNALMEFSNQKINEHHINAKQSKE